MKKMMIAVLILSIMLNLCACSTSVGKVSGVTDPMTYFVSDSSWTFTEIENQFGAFEASKAEKYPAYGYTQYNASNISAFGESWSFWIRVSEQSNHSILGGNFSFDQNNISDKAFIAYRDEIIAHFTALYGNPEQHYASSNMPAWSWTASTITIILQDCRARTGNMNLTFSR